MKPKQTEMKLSSQQKSPSLPESGVRKNLKYVVITAARNEAQYIELTIKAVVAQLVRPVKWVIVSDGSTDGTDEIIRKYAAQHSWIDLVCMSDRKKRDFGGKVYSIRAGLAHLGVLHYDVIANLDADVSFDANYFDFLLKKLEENPRLGVVGTALNENARNKYDYRLTLLAHVSGPCQVFRRECYEEIGGYTPLKQGGVDFSAVWKARARGWETQTFPEMAYEHHRPMSSAKHAGLKLCIYTGRMDYVQGNHVVWELLRCLNQMRGRPYLVGGALTFCSYIWHSFKGVERVIPDDAVRLLQHEQLLQLRKFVRRNRRGGGELVRH
jgi:glycosyltransferase involved in cell wall biosynthesis